MDLLLPSAFLLLSFLFLLLLKNNHCRGNTPNDPNLPPSPPKLPIIGNLHQLGKFPHRSLCQLSKKYGPAMLLQLGRVPTLVVSSPDAARDVLKTHDIHCCSRYPLTGPKRLSYNFLDIAFGPYSDYWKEMRKICALELFSAKRIQSFRHVREEEVARMIHVISMACQRPVNLTEELSSLTDRIICRAAFGRSYLGCRTFENGRFHEALTEAVGLLRSFSAADFFPSAGWIVDRLSGFHAKLEKSFHEMDHFLQWVIDDHLNSMRPNTEQEDIADVLLQLEGKELGGVHLTKNHIKAVLMTIFLAGVQSSFVAMVWAMAELAKNPEVMKKLQTEIRNCIGSKGKVDESDLDQLEFLKMVMKETLRLHPAGTTLVPRETIRRCKIGGYDIYPKTRIEVNVWAMARDPQYWKHPEEFCPERFMDSSIEFKGQHFELLPFGAGRRGCPSINMASVIMELALANLVYSFNWELPGGTKNIDDLSMEESSGVAGHRKAPLLLVPSNYI